MANSPDESTHSSSYWIDGLRSGDAEAIERILARYQTTVVGYAEYRLKQLGIRTQDADDIAQQVFMGLVRRVRAGQFNNLVDRDDLWLRLRTMTRDRVIDAYRQRHPFTESAIDRIHSNERRDRMEQLIDPRHCESDEAYFLMETALLLDRVNHADSGLGAVFELKIQGYHIQEIADRLKKSKRSVERALALIRKILERQDQS